jgi:hypothetical protein
VEDNMSRLALPAAALLAVSSMAMAEPQKMTDTQLDTIVAGHVNPGGNPCGNSPFDCGNNGWGNGMDPTNPGSDNGLTAPSKTANDSTATSGPNSNPTTSTGR